MKTITMKKARIVSYEIAKLLFEKGFREKVCNVIYPDGTIESCEMFDYNSIDKSQEKIVTYSAPTLNQVSDWLMDEYEIFIEIDYIIKPYNFDGKFKYFVIDTSKDDFGGDVLFRSENALKTKEMALYEAIYKTLNKISVTVDVKTNVLNNEAAIEANFFKELNKKTKIESF